MKLKKYIPDILTLFRLCGGLALVFLPPLSTAFYIVYSACGISDAVDGPIARRMGTVSDFGAALDSVADLVFYMCALMSIFPDLQKVLPAYIWWWVAGVLLLRLSAYFAAFFKYAKFASLHTYLNKATGFLVFLAPYCLLFGSPFFTYYCLFICLIGTLSSGEELLIHLTTPHYVKDKKTIWNIKKKPR